MSDTVFCVRIYLVCVVYAVSDAYCKVLCRLYRVVLYRPIYRVRHKKQPPTKI